MPMGGGRGIHKGGVRLHPWSDHSSAHSTGGKTNMRMTAYPFDLPCVREGVDIQDALLVSKPDWGLDGSAISFDTLQVEIPLGSEGGQVWAMHGNAFLRTPLACCLGHRVQACGDCPCSNSRGGS